jgi:hypothetical protein
MRIAPGAIYQLPSGNVVQLVEIIHRSRLLFRYVQSEWNYTGRGVVLTLDWVQAYATRV